MADETYYLWENLNINWENLNQEWQHIVYEVQRVMRGGGPAGVYDKTFYEDYVKNNPWKQLSKQIGEEKTEKFIKVFCRVNGMIYEDVIHPDSQIKLEVKHFNRVFNESTINVKMKF